MRRSMARTVPAGSRRSDGQRPATTRRGVNRSTHGQPMRMVRLTTADDAVRAPRSSPPGSAPRASCGSCAAASTGPYPIGPVHVFVEPRPTWRRPRPCCLDRRALDADRDERTSSTTGRRVGHRAAAAAPCWRLRRARSARAAGGRAGPPPRDRLTAARRRRRPAPTAATGSGAGRSRRARRRRGGGSAPAVAAGEHRDLEVVGRRACGRARPARRPRRASAPARSRPVAPRRPRARCAMASASPPSTLKRVLVDDGAVVEDVEQLVAGRASRPTSATRISTSIGFISWVKIWPRIWAYWLARLRASTSSRLYW